MNVRFVISRPDAARLRWRIQETRKRMKDLSPAFAAAETPVRRAIADWFDSQGRGGWASLALKTVLARQNRWGYYRTGFKEQATGRILHARHALRDSLTTAGGLNVSSITKRRWTFGTRVKYAGIHHVGGEVGVSRHPLPARRLIPLDSTLPAIVVGAINAHVLWAWRQSYSGSP